MEAIVNMFAGAKDTYIHVFIAIMRYLAPILCFLLVLRCGKPLLTFRREPEIWGWRQKTAHHPLGKCHWQKQA